MAASEMRQPFFLFTTDMFDFQNRAYLDWREQNYFFTQRRYDGF